MRGVSAGMPLIAYPPYQKSADGHRQGAVPEPSRNVTAYTITGMKFSDENACNPRRPPSASARVWLLITIGAQRANESPGTP